MSYGPSSLVANGYWYPDRRWINVFPGNATFTADTDNHIEARRTTGSARSRAEAPENQVRHYQGGGRRRQRDQAIVRVLKLGL
jgi:hypothetical protein